MATPTHRFRLAAIGLTAATLAFVSGSTMGCGTQCDRHPDEAPIRYDGGVTDLATGTYFSSVVGTPSGGGPSEPWLDFPPGRTYRFFHGLGGVPQSFQAWLSFSVRPLDGKVGGFVESAGNQVTFEGATAEYVDVRNDTCSEVWIRVEVSDPKLVSEFDAAVRSMGSAGDAGDGGP